MKRRSFIKALLKTAVVVAVAPTEIINAMGAVSTPMIQGELGRFEGMRIMAIKEQWLKRMILQFEDDTINCRCAVLPINQSSINTFDKIRKEMGQ